MTQSGEAQAASGSLRRAAAVLAASSTGAVANIPPDFSGADAAEVASAIKAAVGREAERHAAKLLRGVVRADARGCTIVPIQKVVLFVVGDDLSPAAENGKPCEFGRHVHQGDKDKEAGEDASDYTNVGDGTSDSTGEIKGGRTVEGAATWLRRALDTPVLVPCNADSWSDALSVGGGVAIVARASEVLKYQQESEAQLLSRAHLLIYDAAERARHWRDPIARLLRDSVPPKHLRVFGLARTDLGEGERFGVEDALRLRWYFGGANAVLVMRERLTRHDYNGFAPLTEQHTLKYSLAEVPEATAAATAAAASGATEGGILAADGIHRFPKPGGRSARHMTDKLHISAEVGPLGVVLYERRVNLRRLRWKYRRLLQKNRGNGTSPSGTKEAALDDAIADVDEASGRDLLLGLHPKALSLLNLLYMSASVAEAADACLVAEAVAAASSGNRPSLLFAQADGATTHRPSSFRAIVHCGHPAVAAALNEVLRSLPGFSGVTSSVVMGDAQAAKPLRKVRDTGEVFDAIQGWQGAETDDEAINAFTSGDVHVIFLASANMGSIARNRRELPPSPLVIRYDGSPCNIEFDGGGGRCKVVTFVPKTSGPAGNTRSPRRTNGNEVGNEGDKKAIPSTEPDVLMADHSSTHQSNVAPDRIDVANRSLPKAGTRVNAPGNMVAARYEDVEGVGSSFSVQTRPPPALLGPPDNGGEICYLYTISPIVPGGRTSGRLASERLLGDYVLALSTNLNDCDLLLDCFGERSDSGENHMEGRLRLIRAGSAVLSKEQVSQGRIYTSVLLGVALKRTPAQMFQWGNIAGENGDQTRRYLVLPAKQTSHTTPAKKSCLASSHPPSFETYQDFLFFYFGSGFIGEVSDPCIGEGRTPRGRVAGDVREVDGGETPETPVEDTEETESVIDWATIREIVAFEAESRAGERNVPVGDASDWQVSMVHPDPYGHLEGKLVSMAFDGRRQAVLIARVVRDFSPLTAFIHQKKFCLGPDGYFANAKAAFDELLMSGTDILRCEATNEVEPRKKPLKRQRESGGVQGSPALNDDGVLAEEGRPVKKKKSAVLVGEEGNLSAAQVDPEGQARNEQPGSVHFEKEGSLGRNSSSQDLSEKVQDAVDGVDGVTQPSSGSTGSPSLKDFDWFQRGTDAAINTSVAADSGRVVQTFNQSKNRKKKRTAWYGPVAETYEKYFRTRHGATVQHLHQPLCVTVPPDTFQMGDVLDLAHGASVGAAAQSFLNAQVKVNPDAIWHVPAELTRVYPINHTALMLPPVLLRLEEHLKGCALRSKFADYVKVPIDVQELSVAVTSTAVSSATNYERLELLGDALLKLASTLRLFTWHPHKAEGDLHPLRCDQVCNATLQTKAHETGIQHFLNFTPVSLQNWTPPGYDADAVPLPIPDKALADVLEALIGAYYLRGATDAAKRRRECERVGSSQAKNSTDSMKGKAVVGDAVTRAASSVAVSAEDVVEESGYGCDSQPGIGAGCRRGLTEEDGGDEGHAVLPIRDANAIFKGYLVGTRLLEVLNVLDGSEPSCEEVLLSAIHAMHPPGTPAPRCISASAFPRDNRLINPSKPWAQHLGRVEQEIGYRFKNRQLLFAAFTHASWTERMPNDGTATSSPHESFQRLEFLGDAVLDFFVASYLFSRYANQGPGELTELKSAVVSNESFARISVKHKLYKFLYCNSSSMLKEVDAFVSAYEAEVVNGDVENERVWSRQQDSPKILGDIFEAVIGAILVDAGLERAWSVCFKLLEDSMLKNADPATFSTHPVKLLQDFVTKNRKLSITAPFYHVPEKPVPTGKVGPNGKKEKLMRAEVYVHNIPIAHGFASSKKRAQAIAAAQALERLNAAGVDPESTKLMERLQLAGDKERTAKVRKH